MAGTVSLGDTTAKALCTVTQHRFGSQLTQVARELAARVLSTVLDILHARAIAITITSATVRTVAQAAVAIDQILGAITQRAHRLHAAARHEFFHTLGQIVRVEFDVRRKIGLIGEDPLFVLEALEQSHTGNEVSLVALTARRNIKC